MKIISHRGNLNGPSKKENEPNQVDYCLHKDIDCEIDVWYHENDFYLGHDSPTYKINIDWIKARSDKLWIHCKNIEVLAILLENNDKSLNFFWHQNDFYTLTSKSYIWSYPGSKLMPGAVAVLPELWVNEENFYELYKCFAICTDFVNNYAEQLK